MMYIIIAIILSVSAFLFWASYSISSGVYMRSFCRNRNAGRVIALTFDDGVDESLTPQVLDVLKKYDIKATFFVIGERAERSPHIVKRIVEEGHIVGNHTYSHEGYFPLKSSKAMVADLTKAENAIKMACGIEVEYFRPPFGVTNPMVAQAVKKMGYMSIGWSIRSLDTMKMTREKVLERVIDRLHDGAIILLHDNRENSPRLVENIITISLAKGYTFVNVDELLG